METVHVKLTGTSPLLMHHDNIEWADKMELWKTDPANKGASKPGDDRTPPWRWLGCLYTDDPVNGVVTLPYENIMKTIMEGAMRVPTGRRQETFKALSQCGILCSEFHWPLIVNGKPISFAALKKCESFKTYHEHTEFVRTLGFQLFAKRAKIGNAKHVRVRPRFDGWSAEGDLVITEDQITKPILRTILTEAGRYKGLCDWRPSSGRPGPWGMFSAEVS